MPGRPTNLDKSRARACCTAVGADEIVRPFQFSFLSPSLSGRWPNIDRNTVSKGR